MSHGARSLALPLFLLLSVGASHQAGAARIGASRCLIGRLTCKDRLLVCRFNVEAAARLAGTAPDAGKLQQCRDKFDGGGDLTRGCYGKLDAGVGQCTFSGTTVSDEDDIDNFIDNVVAALDPNPADDLNTCTAAKLRCVRKKVQCIIDRYRQGLRRYGGPLDQQACRDRFDDPVHGCFATREAAGGCLTIGDAPALETQVDCFFDSSACPTPTPTPTP